MSVNEQESYAPRRWAVSLPTLLLFAFVVYESTAEAWAGVWLLCSKFGWEDFCTALWLRRRDADTQRSRTHFWAYLGLGLLKVALAGTIFMCVIVVLSFCLEAWGPVQLGKAPERYGIEAVATAFVGILASGLTTSWALVRAQWHRQKIWVNSRVRFARRTNLWPIPLETLQGSNDARMLVAPAFFVTLFPAAFASFVFLFIWLDPQGGPAAAVVIVMLVINLFVVPFMLLAGTDYAKQHLLANHPLEVWASEGLLPPDHGQRTLDYQQ